MAEDTKEELDFWSAVRPLHRVMIFSKADKVADPFGLFTGKQRGCHRNHDQARLKAGTHELNLEVGVSEAVAPCIEEVRLVDRE